MTITPQEQDWLDVYFVWSNHRRIEAADSGYDFAAGAEARREYGDAITAYRRKHGEAWKADPERCRELLARKEAA